MSVLMEAEEIADVHLVVRDRLLADVIVQLREWKAANYHKQMVGSCKEAKAFDDDFQKVCNHLSAVETQLKFSSHDREHLPCYQHLRCVCTERHRSLGQRSWRRWRSQRRIITTHVKL